MAQTRSSDRTLKGDSRSARVRQPRSRALRRPATQTADQRGKLRARREQAQLTIMHLRRSAAGSQAVSGAVYGRSNRPGAPRVISQAPRELDKPTAVDLRQTLFVLDRVAYVPRPER
jgi:hypothetical protein